MKREALALLLAFAAAQAEGGELEFVPPAPGTYELQRIFPAPEGAVVDVEGKPKRLSTFTRGKITVLSLIYTKCGDGMGCPLATHRMKQLKERLDGVTGLAPRVRFVSLSFDPDHDTPEVMRAYRGEHVGDDSGLRWDFLTTRSRSEIEPLLRGFGQDVWTPRDGGGALAHVLKVFLIDRRGTVREIYSTSFLQTQVVLNDIETLLLEEQPRRG